VKKKFRARRSGFFRFIVLCWLLTAATLSCVKLPRRAADVAGQNAPHAAHVGTHSEPLININTATREQLERLPGVGVALAARVLEHREKYGRFRRIEHLLMVRGISERRFRAMNSFLTTE
jgi:competence ComEA-like helix-hairpin-helix protein